MRLSKSQYIRGLQCHKALWQYHHRRERMSAADASREALFATGHEVGRLAQALDDGLIVDAVLAMNFSYQIFKTRDKLRGYFSKAREALADEGILFIDAFGGYDSFKEIREKRKFKHFKYIWEHARYNPINGDILCHIHFTFPDGSKLKKAFTYDWRLWTLPELQELLTEAGYSRVSVYWEETDEDSGEGNGHYSPATVGEADPSWVCFLVAEK